MLLTNRLDFSNFAAFNGPPDSRLYISIADPSEVLYIGLSCEYDDWGNPFLAQSESRFLFQIRKKTDNGEDPIVHGPFRIDRDNQNITSWGNAFWGDGGYVTDNLIQPNPANNNEDGLVYEFRPGEAGDYYIEFRDLDDTTTGDDRNSKVLIGFWDFTVAKDGAAQLGRVWSRNWAFRTPVENVTDPDLIECGWDREFNGTLYSYTSDGFVSEINFEDSGFQGLAFTVAFNSTGPNTSGDFAHRRRSIPGRNLTGSSAEHRIFLNEPDPILFPDGCFGEVETAPTFQCRDEGFALPVSATRPGQVEVILDFNQNGIFDIGSEDVSIIHVFEPEDFGNGTDFFNCEDQEKASFDILWNGLKGDSTPVAFGDTINLILLYTQGIQHWAVYDAEFLKQGFCVETIRPKPPGDVEMQTNRLYWDDSLIPEDPETGQPKVNLNGCICRTDGCRTWTNFNPNQDCELRNLKDSFTTGYGDKNTLNTWWFASTSKQTSANIPILTCQITGRDTICEGEFTEFTVEVSSEAGSLSWTGPNGFSKTGPTSGPVSEPGIYTVTASDNTGCSTTCSVELVVVPNPSLNLISVTDASCPDAADGIITVEASGGSGQYAFAINGRNTQSEGSFTSLTAGTYTISVQDIFGCSDSLQVEVGASELPQLNYPEKLTICPGESVQAPPSGPDNLFYVWSPDTGIDDINSPTPTFSPVVTTTYFVSAGKTSDQICVARDTVIVEVLPAPEITVTGDTVLCDGEANLLASSDDPSAVFSWLSPNGEVLTTGPEFQRTINQDLIITLRAAATNGCISEREILLRNAAIDVSVPDQVAACLGEPLPLEVVNNKPADQLTYSWTPVDAFEPGTANSASPILIPEVGEQKVFVTIENQDGCSYTDSVTVAVVDPDFSLDFSTELECNGATVQFMNTSSTNAFGLQWNFGDPNNPEAGSTEENPSYTYTEAGTYTVTLTLKYDVSCTDTISREVVVTDPQIIAAFDYELTDCAPEGATVQFTDASTNSFNNTIGWEWTFGNGDSSNDQNPSILVTESGPLSVELTITTANDCQATVRDTIDLLLPTLNLQDTVFLCPGDSVTLNPDGDPAFEYEWSPAGGLSSTDAASPVASPAQSTTYTVTVRAVADAVCERTEQVTVLVADPLNLDAGPDQFTCGEDAVLAASFNGQINRIRWFNADGATISTDTSVVVNPFKAATYYVTATTPEGCSETDSVTVTDQGVDVQMLTDDIVGCGPQTVQIEVANQDLEDILIFDWQPAEFIVEGANTSSPTVRVERGSVTFRARIENQFGCLDSVAVDITALTFDTNLPDTVIVCAGENKALAPEANTAYQYQWSPAEGLNDPNAPNPIFSGTENTTYVVTVSGQVDGVDCTITDTVMVIVRPPINLQTTPDTVLCMPGSLTLNASSDLDTVAFSWFDGPSLDSLIGIGPQITVTPPVGDTTDYYVVARDLEGCTEVGLIRVFVPDLPNVLPPPTVGACAGDPVRINPNGNPDFVYQWDPEIGLDLSEPWNPVATLETDIDYSVTVTDPATGCTATGSVLVVVNPPLNLQASPDTTLCEPETVTLEAQTDVPATIRWYDNPAFEGDPVATGNTYTFTPEASSVTTFYILADDGSICTEEASVTVRVEAPINTQLPDSLTVCTGDPTSISLDTALQYDWLDQTGLDLSDPANPVITLDDSRTYVVDVTDPLTNCTKRDTLNVEVLPKLNLAISPADTTLCEQDTVTFTASTDIDAVFSWFDNPALEGDPVATGPTLTVTPSTGTTTYYVLAEGMDVCQDSSITTATVTVLDLPEASGLPEAVSGCAGDQVTLELNEQFTYEWTPQTGLDLSNPAQPVIILEQDALYTIMITDPKTGCTATVELPVSVSPAVMFTVEPSDTTLCEIQTIELSAATNLPATIRWFDNPDGSGDPIATGSPLVITPPAGTNTYYVIAEIGGECPSSDTASATVTVFDLPGNSGIPADTSACEGDLITLNLNPDYQYEWSPTTGLDLSDPANPVITAAESTTYSISITDPATGCEATTTFQLNVTPTPALTVSNDTTLCEITEITLTADAGEAPIAWYDNPGFSGDPLATGGAYTVTPPLGATTYYVIAGADTECPATDSVTVTVFDLPGTSGIPADTTVCEGEVITLNLNPEYEYEWSPTTGLDLSDPANPVITAVESTLYSITITDPATGCEATTTLQLTVTPTPDLTVSNDTTLCEITELTLTAEAGGAPVAWYDNPGFSGDPLATGETYTVTPPLGATTYYVIAGADTECPATDSVTVTVFDLPGNSGIPADTSACEGDVIVLNLNPDYEYEWSPTTGLDLSDPANPVITAVESTTYSISITDPATGCEATTTLQLTVTPTPDLTVSNDTTLCEITELTLTAEAGGAPVAWYDNPGFSGDPLATGETYTVTPPLGSTTYYVIAGAGTECPATDSVTVTVFDLPGNSGIPADTSACEGDVIVLNLNPDYEYEWSPTTGLDLSDPANPVITAVESTSFSITITDPATGCEATTTFNLEVSPNVEIQLSPADTTLCEPAPVTITATTEGPADISWYTNADLSGDPFATGGTVTVDPPVGTTTLYVLAEGTGACTKNDTAVARIFVLNPFEGVDFPEGPIRGCTGQIVILALPDGFEYEWSPQEGLDLEDPLNPRILIGDPVTYTLTVTDTPTGCTKTITLEAGPYPPIGLTLNRNIDTVLCAPGTIFLEASTTRPARINWYDSSNFGNVDSLGTGNIFPVDIESGSQTYYAVAFSPESCTEIDSITVSVKDLFDESGLDELPDTTLRACVNEPATLSLNPEFTYEWAPLDDGINAGDPANPVFTLSENRTYSVTISDEVSGCTDTVAVDIELNPDLNLVVSDGDTLCTEMPVTLNAGTAVPSTIEWSSNRNFDPVEGTGSEFTVTPPRGSTVYYVQATDTTALGCTAIDSVQVDFYPINAELPPVVSCEPVETLELQVNNLDPAQELEYMWFPEQAIVSDPTMGPAASVDPALATEFSVDLINQYGCTATLSTTAEVILLPEIIDVTADPDTILAGESSALSVTGCEDCTYSWSPAGTLDQPDSPNPTATPDVTTTYTVTVEKKGCVTDTSVTVVVEEFECGPPYVYLPNAFTPNGDGVNDVLYVRGSNIDRVSLIIFNRWGQKVFESNSQEEGWDGTFQGRELPPDVYGYFLEVQCGDVIYREQGNVTLLR